jgi:hypothetical protein
MTRNDNNTKGNEMLAKLQAFADTLDINEATVEIGTHDHDRGVVWLKYRRVGCDRINSIACGLVEHGIRYVKRQMREFEASLA